MHVDKGANPQFDILKPKKVQQLFANASQRDSIGHKNPRLQSSAQKANASEAPGSAMPAKAKSFKVQKSQKMGQ